ncbi:hypothetical protein AABB24_027580, partial [Solanum stoloniferum]
HSKQHHTSRPYRSYPFSRMPDDAATEPATQLSSSTIPATRHAFPSLWHEIETRRAQGRINRSQASVSPFPLPEWVELAGKGVAPNWCKKFMAFEFRMDPLPMRIPSVSPQFLP